MSRSLLLRDLAAQTLLAAVISLLFSVVGAVPWVLDRRHWDILASVTHWTDEDVLREADLKRRFAENTPDRPVDKFSELLDVF
jgi:phosphoglycolate phosphatase